MTHVRYSEMVACYGSGLAYDLLLALEKATRIPHEGSGMDEEARLKRVIETMGATTARA